MNIMGPRVGKCEIVLIHGRARESRFFTILIETCVKHRLGRPSTESQIKGRNRAMEDRNSTADAKGGV